MTIEQEWVSKTTNLFTLPEVYLRLQQVLAADDVSMREVADVITYDPALTARLLRIVNSAFFGFGQKIETVSHSINMMGTQQVHDLALATSVTSTFNDIPDDVINMSQFWRDAVYCGVLARLLAKRCNVLDSDRLFVAGLLHDLGHLIMYQNVPEQMAEAKQRSKTEGVALHQIEKELTGSDYATVGGELMRAWDLPNSLMITTKYHLSPAQAPEFELQTAIIHIAAAIVQSHADDSEDTKSTPVIDPVAWQITNVTPDDIEPLYDEAGQQLFQAISLLFPVKRVASVSR